LQPDVKNGNVFADLHERETNQENRKAGILTVAAVYERRILGARKAPLQANSTARLIAAIMLSGRAIPFPAISNAVP
jgi:hypothetical protein